MQSVVEFNLKERLIFCRSDMTYLPGTNDLSKELYWPAILFLHYSEYQVYLQQQLSPWSMAHGTALEVYHNSRDKNDNDVGRRLSVHPLLALCLGKKDEENNKVIMVYDREQYKLYMSGLMDAIIAARDTSLHMNADEHLSFANGIDDGNIIMGLVEAPHRSVVQYAKRSINKNHFVTKYGDPEITSNDSFDQAWTKLQFIGFTEYMTPDLKRWYVFPGKVFVGGVLESDYLSKEGIKVILECNFGLGLGV
jgi:hypothetical protein